MLCFDLKKLKMRFSNTDGGHSLSNTQQKDWNMNRIYRSN